VSVKHHENAEGVTVTRTAPHQPDAAEQQAREQAVTDEVVASFATSTSDRYRVVMTSLVRHLHGFARDVRLTHAEWETAVDFLTRTGQISDGRRQEFILLSDVLGLSMLTVGINAPASHGATESTVFGPFFVDDAPEVPLGGDIAQGAKGTQCWVAGQVRSTDGAPLPGVRLDAWEADEDGLYDTQYAGNRTAGRGWQITGANGEYRFWSVLPTHYPVPDDGPVGELVAAAGRHPMRPAHLHFKVTAPGHRTLITHVFVAGDEYLHNDAVFGVKDSLVAEFTEHQGGTAPDGSAPDGRWTQVEFDLVLAREEQP
jgi:hydroxyquinol 1,2-dioxygenase